MGDVDENHDAWRVAVALAFSVLGRSKRESAGQRTSFVYDDICRALSICWPDLCRLKIFKTSFLLFDRRNVVDELNKVCFPAQSRKHLAETPGLWTFTKTQQQDALSRIAIEDSHVSFLARKLGASSQEMKRDYLKVDAETRAFVGRPGAKTSKRRRASTALRENTGRPSKAAASSTCLPQSPMAWPVSVAARPTVDHLLDAEVESGPDALPQLAIFTGKTKPSRVPKTTPSVRRSADSLENNFKPHHCHQLRRVPSNRRSTFIPPPKRHCNDGSEYELGEGYFFHQMFLKEESGALHSIRRPLQIPGLTSVRTKPVPGKYNYKLEIENPHRFPMLRRYVDALDRFYVSDEYTDFLKVRWLGRVSVLDAVLDSAVFKFVRVSCEVDPSREGFSEVEDLLGALAYCNPQLSPVSSSLPNGTAAIEGWRRMLDLPCVVKEDSQLPEL